MWGFIGFDFAGWLNKKSVDCGLETECGGNGMHSVYINSVEKNGQKI